MKCEEDREDQTFNGNRLLMWRRAIIHNDHSLIGIDVDIARTVINDNCSRINSVSFRYDHIFPLLNVMNLKSSQAYLNWLLSTAGSSDFTLSSIRASELLALSLRVRPTTLRRKLISAASTCDRALSVAMQNS